MSQKQYREIFSKRVAVLAALGLVGTAAFGQTFSAAQDIATAAGTTAPASGTTWTLGAPGPFLTSTVSLPAGGALTLDGGGYALPLTDGTNHGRFSATTGNRLYTLNLTNITLTQGSATGGAPGSFGGAITTSNDGTRSLNINAAGVVALTKHSATGNGGAIYSGGQLNIAVDQAFTLSGNTAGGTGGAINTYTGGGVALTGGSASAITLDGNRATSAGGAILVTSVGGVLTSGVAIDAGTISITNNKSVNGIGGAISTPNALSIGNPDSSVTITGNSAGTSGGALDGDNAGAGTVTTIDGSQITINNNTANNNGGAIYSLPNDNSSITIGNPASTVGISGNSAQYGGAISGRTTLHGASIALANNQASKYGGAIYVDNGYPVVIGDAASALAISGNSAPAGGVVFALGSPITFNGGGLISGNTATDAGGALYAQGDLTLNATASDGLTFSGNAPEAITIDNYAAATSIAFNASGGNIVFNDPIDSYAYTLSALVTTGPRAVIFDGATSASSYVYAAATVQSGVFAVQNNSSYGALAVDLTALGGAPDPTSFTVALGATLAGGGTGTVRADDFSLGGTLDISGSGVTATNAAVGHPPGNAAANGLSAFNIQAVNASLSGGTVLVNLCGDQQSADLLNLDSPNAITGGAQLVVTQIDGCKGAATTGDGIQIVKSSSATDNLFTTPSGATLNIGSAAYTLKQIGNDWYLQSTGQIFVSAAVPVPTQSESALALLALLLGGGAALTLRRKQAGR
jgi:predicted outer membrane repeat protein